MGNIKTEWNGLKYDSKKEALYAQELELRKKAKDIKDWIPQYKLEIKVKKKHICNYFVDFKVVMKDGSIEMHEVKGHETSVFKLKWKLANALYDTIYRFVLIH